MTDDAPLTYGPFGTAEHVAEERYRTMIRLANIEYVYRGHVLRVVLERPLIDDPYVVIPGYEVDWVAYQGTDPSTYEEIARGYIQDERGVGSPKVFPLRRRRHAIDAGLAAAASALDEYLARPGAANWRYGITDPDKQAAYARALSERLRQVFSAGSA